MLQATIFAAWRWVMVFTVCLLAWPTGPLLADTLDTIRERGHFIWGADKEGGGPYVYPHPDDPQQLTGFEYDLAMLLAKELGVGAEFRQGNWADLPSLLATGEIDLVLNGYELNPTRAAMMLPSQPYFVFQLALVARKERDDLKSLEDLRARPGRSAPKVGVLTGSTAESHLRDLPFADEFEIVSYDINTDAMRDVETGRLDATFLDLLCWEFFQERYPRLARFGDPVGRGFFVIFVRSDDPRLRDEVNRGLAALIENGSLKQVYTRYGIWNAEQENLAAAAQEASAIRAETVGGWQVIVERGPLLARAALVTMMLACASMPLAILLGLCVALIRLYGPRPLQWLTLVYVEILRGTPLMLQLFVLFYLLPEVMNGLLPQVDWVIPAWVAAIIGLGVNYSAYEAEIYRAGLLAIPNGQMEAARALGMSRKMALMRVLIPQATRSVLPPVTNDFIALFKDTSVCSVITVVELTKEYSIERNDTGATIELAFLTGLLYLMMSLPLSFLSSRMEKWLHGKGARATG